VTVLRETLEAGVSVSLVACRHRAGGLAWLPTTRQTRVAEFLA
jgi:hypothetical protein